MNTIKEVKPEEKWDIVVEPKKGLFDFDFTEIIKSRELISVFVKRDFTVTYKQTILGPLWYLIQPLFSTVIYTFVFGNIAQMGTDGIPNTLFYYGGTMLWTYFVGCFNICAATFSANTALFGKVYFPRLVAPISACIGQVVKLGIQFLMLLIFYVYFLIMKAPIVPSWWVLAFPLLLIWIGLLGAGLGLIVTTLTSKYRDLNHLVAFGLQLAMYVTPVVYPLSEASQNYIWFFYINPMSAPVELFRIWFYGAGYVPVEMIIISLAWTIIGLFTGLVLFKRRERTFIDII